MDENKVAENVDGGNNVLQHSGSCSVTGPFITFGDIVTTSFHNSVHLSPQQVFKLIDRDIKNAITARQRKMNFLGLMTFWIR
ncbi:hypothetical protein DY000_02054560 [Brassica cretica]|uniref:Uncharacterized protein n=1 Tax=Brassica cretica TaxID=69181 RepID=A0ABQ7AJG1_BRACR|nr:hypothetical protein DY000_02054560 [Brassica cretica]